MAVSTQEVIEARDQSSETSVRRTLNILYVHFKASIQIGKQSHSYVYASQVTVYQFPKQDVVNPKAVIFTEVFEFSSRLG